MVFWSQFRCPFPARMACFPQDSLESDSADVHDESVRQINRQNDNFYHTLGPFLKRFVLNVTLHNMVPAVIGFSSYSFDLNEVTQGLDDTKRVGLRIWMRRLVLEGFILLPANSGFVLGAAPTFPDFFIGSGAPRVIRVVLVKSDRALATGATLWDNATSSAAYSCSARDIDRQGNKFVILWERLIILDPQKAVQLASAGETIVPYRPSLRADFSFDIPLDEIGVFDDTDGSMLLGRLRFMYYFYCPDIMLSSLGTPLPMYLNFSSRFSFTDK